MHGQCVGKSSNRSVNSSSVVRTTNFRTLLNSLRLTRPAICFASTAINNRWKVAESGSVSIPSAGASCTSSKNEEIEPDLWPLSLRISVLLNSRKRQQAFSTNQLMNETLWHCFGKKNQVRRHFWHACSGYTGF